MKAERGLLLTAKERELKMCAGEIKLVLVKIQFEEVMFNIGFERREGRALKVSEMKGIPDLCSRKAEDMTNKLFSFEGGDAKGSINRRRTQS